MIVVDVPSLVFDDAESVINVVLFVINGKGLVVSVAG